MKKIVFVGVIVLGIATFGFLYSNTRGKTRGDKIYVAVEGDGSVAVIDPTKREVVKTIDLSIEHDGGQLVYAPHNVQVSPDGLTLWVTANSGAHEEEHSKSFIPVALANGDDHADAGEEADEVIVISTNTDAIVKRIPLKKRVHLAHIVLTPDTRYAVATTQTEGSIYIFDAQLLTLKDEIVAPKGSEPHGLRVSPDGKTAYIAMLKGKNLGILDIASKKLTEVPLGGQAVQTGVTPDGKYAVASLYDTKELAVYETASKQLSKVGLPKTAKGPVQMYVTPDSRYIYLADQGYYFEQPISDLVYKIDLTKQTVVKEIKGGQGPHGVVISPDGRYVYVTNIVSGDVSVIETATDQEVAKIPVGKEPNGISYLSSR